MMQLELGGIVINTETGEVPYTKEILHEIFKRKYLVKQVIETKKKSIEIYSSTTDLSTKEFVEFCENVKKFCLPVLEYKHSANQWEFSVFMAAMGKKKREVSRCKGRLQSSLEEQIRMSVIT